MTLLFWGAVLFIAYVYVGYPALLALWATWSPRRWQASSGDRFPSISIVVAARNEGARLPARLDNLLSLAYPGSPAQIIIASDGSSDDTAALVAPYGDRVELLMLPPRGKAAALNAAVERANGEVVVFADARQSFGRNALIALARPFADPSVGGVSGELIMGCEPASGRRRGRDRRDDEHPVAVDHRTSIPRRRDEASTVGEALGIYWRYEKALRKHESAVHSMVGATGAIYALRRSLWRPLPDDTLLDDVLAPMRAVLAGSRVVFEEHAAAYDRTAPDASAESRRKVRTLAGNVQILWLEPRLLVPFMNPVWIQYLSHKIGRLLVPYAMLMVLVSNMVLAETHGLYAAVLAGQCAFYLLAGYGAVLERRRRPRVAVGSGAVALEPALTDSRGALHVRG
jgi:cellulose synthase/poly-beta-1,6-N-acetylglucosamine synthase-like glycosyltransferase